MKSNLISLTNVAVILVVLFCALDSSNSFVCNIWHGQECFPHEDCWRCIAWVPFTNESAAIANKLNFRCPTPFGYYQHEDCWKFWHCTNGIAFETVCPKGTQWNQYELSCEHLSDCQRPDDDRSTTIRTTTWKPETTTRLWTTTDKTTFWCPARFGYYPHKDCWKFWQCSNWIPYAMECPRGTQWVQRKLTCDHLTDCQRPDL